MVTSPLEQSPRLSEVVAERLLALMRNGDLGEGMKLPPERELAESLGVSRTSLREGLSALQLAGLIERRQGVGTVVKRVVGGVNLASLQAQVRAGVTIVELIDARLALELGIAHLLVEQKHRIFDEVDALLAEMTDAVRLRHSIDGYIGPSFDFHVALARVSRQPLLVSFIESVYEEMRPHLWLIVKSYTLEVAEHSLEMHELILESIKRRDIISALATIERHYRRYPALQTRHIANGL